MTGGGVGFDRDSSDADAAEEGGDQACTFLGCGDGDRGLFSGEGLLTFSFFAGYRLLAFFCFFSGTGEGDFARAFFDAGVKSISESLLPSSSTVSADFGRFLMLENNFVETFVGVDFVDLSSLSLDCFEHFGPSLGLADLGPRNLADFGPGLELLGPGLESPDFSGVADTDAGVDEGFFFGRIFLFGVPSDADFFGVFLTDDGPPSEALATRTFLA